nr:pilus assembly protein TadG-related protein [Mesorhizobium sp. B2-6-5]
MLPVLVGFSLLAIDMSRASSLHNDPQKGVDALALAAAAELDGRSDNITRQITPSPIWSATRPCFRHQALMRSHASLRAHGGRQIPLIHA